MKFIPLTIPLTIGTLIVASLATMSLAQNSRVIASPDDNSFASQAFSSSLFKKIPQGDKACRAYQGKPYCSYKKQYIFKDVVLVSEGNVPSDGKLTVIPTKPVAVDQALSYAKIVTLSKGMTYGSPSELTRNKIVYQGCKFENFYLCNTVLTLDSEGKVVRIKHEYGSP